MFRGRGHITGSPFLVWWPIKDPESDWDKRCSTGHGLNLCLPTTVVPPGTLKDPCAGSDLVRGLLKEFQVALQ